MATVFQTGRRVNTGTFVDNSDTGTNPLVADTDGDGMMDGDETYQGFNPTDPASHFVEPQDFWFSGSLDIPGRFTILGEEQPIARTQTTSWSSGNFEITLPPGRYKLKVNSHQSTYKSEWYKGPDSTASDVFDWDNAYIIDLSTDLTGWMLNWERHPPGWSRALSRTHPT